MKCARGARCFPRANTRRELDTWRRKGHGQHSSFYCCNIKCTEPAQTLIKACACPAPLSNSTLPLTRKLTNLKPSLAKLKESLGWASVPKHHESLPARLPAVAQNRPSPYSPSIPRQHGHPPPCEAGSRAIGSGTNHDDAARGVEPPLTLNPKP